MSHPGAVALSDGLAGLFRRGLRFGGEREPDGEAAGPFPPAIDFRQPVAAVENHPGVLLWRQGVADPQVDCGGGWVRRRDRGEPLGAAAAFDQDRVLARVGLSFHTS